MRFDDVQALETASVSSRDRLFAASLAAFSMFVVGYSATRVVLNATAVEPAATVAPVVPHASTLWSPLGR